MRIAVFDTETTSLEKPFCYNIGYIIYDTETGERLIKHDFVAEQIWHNRELFTTAYYAEKRDEYINRMRGKTCEMKKLGHITQIMCREFADFEVVAAFAYNSPFDDKVFNFNCEWFKIKNPFDNIPIFDIRGYVHRKLAFTPEYKRFCENNEYYTESGNYSTTAETVYRFLTNNTEFIEEHTALADAEIELDILLKCIELGCEWNTEYKVYRTIQRVVDKQLEVKDTEQQWCFRCLKPLQSRCCQILGKVSLCTPPRPMGQPAGQNLGHLYRSQLFAQGKSRPILQ